MEFFESFDSLVLENGRFIVRKSSTAVFGVRIASWALLII